MRRGQNVHSGYRGGKARTHRRAAHVIVLQRRLLRQHGVRHVEAGPLAAEVRPACAEAGSGVSGTQIVKSARAAGQEPPRSRSKAAAQAAIGAPHAAQRAAGAADAAAPARTGC